MASKTDFQSDVIDVNIVGSSAGAKVQEAGRKLAQAETIESGARRDLFLETAGLGIQAGTDIAKSIFGERVQEQIDMLEGHGKVAREAQAELDLLDRRIVEEADTALSEGGPFSVPRDPRSGEEHDLHGENVKKHMQRFVDDVQPELRALRGKILDRDTVLRNIASLTKQYIAQMPGLASMYRQKAAELTGINDVDSYHVRQALTTESAQEKLAKANATAALDLEKDIAQFFGYSSLDQISDTDRNVYRSFKTLENTSKEIELRAKQKSALVEETDQLHATRVHLELAGSSVNMTASIVRLVQQGMDANTSVMDFHTTLQGGLKNTIETERARIKAMVSGLTFESPKNPNALSSDKAKELITLVDDQFDELDEYFSDAGKFAYFTNLAQNTEMQYDMFRQSLILANPFLEVLDQTGIGPELIKQWFSFPGTADQKYKAMEGAFGKPWAEGVRKIIEQPQWNIVNLHGATKNQSANPTVKSSIKEDAPAAGIPRATPQDNRTYLDSHHAQMGLLRNATDKYQGTGYINSMVSVLNEDGISELDLEQIETSLNQGGLENALKHVEADKARNMANTAMDSLNTRYSRQINLLVSRLTGVPGGIRAEGNPGYISWIPEMGQFEGVDLSDTMEQKVREINTALRISKSLEQAAGSEFANIGQRLADSVETQLRNEVKGLPQEVDDNLRVLGTLRKDFRQLESARAARDISTEDFREITRQLQSVSGQIRELESENKSLRTRQGRANYLLQNLQTTETPLKRDTQPQIDRGTLRDDELEEIPGEKEVPARARAVQSFVDTFDADVIPEDRQERRARMIKLQEFTPVIRRALRDDPDNEQLQRIEEIMNKQFDLLIESFGRDAEEVLTP